jgi:hypothetical protein
MLRSILKKSRPITLGRWARNNEARKVELANHDHCGGPQCSNTELTKSTEYDNTMDFTMCALQSFHVNPTNDPCKKKK